jgi:L-asparaginase II
MANPVLVEVTRGETVESRHSGAAVVIDADGNNLLALGDVDRHVYPRSAVKALQALPLVESGIADRMGLTDAEIALACASHSGEMPHVETVPASMPASSASPAAPAPTRRVTCAPVTRCSRPCGRPSKR